MINSHPVAAKSIDKSNSDVGIEILSLEECVEKEDITNKQAEILEYKLNNNIPWDVNDPIKFSTMPEEYRTLSIDEIDEGITSKEYKFEDGSIFRFN